MSDPHMFSENPPTLPKSGPEIKAPRPVQGPAEVIEKLRDRTTQGMTLAQQIRAAKQKSVSTFTLRHTIPGETWDIKATRPSMLYLATSGRLPATLQNVVGTMFHEDVDADKAGAEVQQMIMQDISLLTEMLYATAVAGFVDPPLVSPVKPGESVPDGYMAVDEIDTEDLLDFFSWVNAGGQVQSEALAEFPETGQAPDVEARPEGAAVQSATFGNTAPVPVGDIP